MPIRTAVHHRTRYTYERPVQLGPQQVRLRPAPHVRAGVEAYSLSVRPAEHSVHWLQDPLGNHVARLVFAELTGSLELMVDLTVELRPFNPFDFFVEPYAERFPFVYEPALRAQLTPYLAVEDSGAEVLEYAEEVSPRDASVVQFLVEFNSRIHADLGFELRYEEGLQSPEQTLQLGKGACRDFAWLQVQVMRRLGLAARFVSGYSIQLQPAVDKDEVALHAWAEAYIPGAGWVGVDGTSGLLAAEGHIPLATAANPQDAAPVIGTMEPCEVTFETEMRVERLPSAGSAV